jgi:hypothetical protein
VSSKQKRKEFDMTKATCIECNRVFDLYKEDDAQEYYYGHDCEKDDEEEHECYGYAISYLTVPSLSFTNKGLRKGQLVDCVECGKELGS